MISARTLLPTMTTMLLVVCAASAARAEPIRVTAGVLEAGFGVLGQPWSGEQLGLTAGELSIGDSLEDVGASFRLAATPTVAQDALIDWSGALQVNDSIGGTENGSFLLVQGPFTIFFTASPTRIACTTADSTTRCNGVAPFTFDATLSLTASNGATTVRHLIGGGTVEGSLFRVGSTEMGGVRYTFDASPVPEPSTLSLLAAGALAAGWRRRRGAAPLR